MRIPIERDIDVIEEQYILVVGCIEFGPGVFRSEEPHAPPDRATMFCDDAYRARATGTRGPRNEERIERKRDYFRAVAPYSEFYFGRRRAPLVIRRALAATHRCGR